MGADASAGGDAPSAKGDPSGGGGGGGGGGAGLMPRALVEAVHSASVALGWSCPVGHEGEALGQGCAAGCEAGASGSSATTEGECPAAPAAGAAAGQRCAARRPPDLNYLLPD